MEPVKLGVIGCGVIGSRNLLDAQDNELIDVVAAGPARERREGAQQEVLRIYEDGCDLLDQDDEVEAVIIAFPPANAPPWPAVLSPAGARAHREAYRTQRP